MKKISFITALVLVFALMAMPASAADYSIPHENIKFSMPDGWFAYTEDTKADDPVIRYFGLTPEEFAARAKETGLYFDSLSPAAAESAIRDGFCISFEENESTKKIFTYSDYTDEELTALAAQTLDALEASKIGGFIRMSHGSYKVNGIKYISVGYWRSIGDDYVHTKQYFTVYNGKMMTLTWNSYNERAMEADAEIIHSILDSLEYTETLRNPNAPMTKGELMKYIFFGLAGITLVAAVVCIAIDASRKKKAAAEVMEAVEDAAEEASEEISEDTEDTPEE